MIALILILIVIHSITHLVPQPTSFIYYSISNKNKINK